jgi:hypothetical protein
MIETIAGVTLMIESACSKLGSPFSTPDETEARGSYRPSVKRIWRAPGPRVPVSGWPFGSERLLPVYPAALGDSASETPTSCVKESANAIDGRRTVE